MTFLSSAYRTEILAFQPSKNDPGFDDMPIPPCPAARQSPHTCVPLHSVLHIRDSNSIFNLKINVFPDLYPQSLVSRAHYQIVVAYLDFPGCSINSSLT